ncbi:MAG: hypothetical protein ACREGI_04050 [Candidatus Levyibacteriota bacterium]
MKKIFIYSLILLALFLGSTHIALAQQSEFNLSTTPHAFDLTSLPGQKISKTIKVRNNTDTSLSLSVTIKKLIPDRSGQILISDFTSSEDYQHWLTIDSSSISALPKEWVDVPFTITIPKDAAYGYYYAILLSASQNQQAVNTPQAKLTGAIAIPVLLDVQKNGTSFSGKLTNFVTSSGFYEYLPVTFLTTFVNMGNVHIKPHGDIFITDWKGTQVASLPVNKDLGSILPNGTRVFATDWNDSFITKDPKIVDNKVATDKNGNPTYELHLHFDRVLHLRMGKYIAHALLVVSTDTKDISYEQTTTFWVFPWKIILGMLVFVLLAGIGLFNTLHSIWKHGKKLLKKS